MPDAFNTARAARYAAAFVASCGVLGGLVGWGWSKVPGRGRR